MTPAPPSLDLAARILHRDASVLVIDKPAGLPVHPGPRSARHGDEPTLAALLPHLAFGLPRPPELAHRLDRDTSGCLVLGRHPRALRRLGELFASGAVDKTYWAVVEGGPEAEEGRIDMALAKKSPDRGWWMKPDPAGLPSSTLFRVLGRDGSRAFLALTPLTGRTHQLRVHCAASGFPILGDGVYGTAPRFGGPMLHLHARAVSLPYDPRKPPVVAQAAAPGHMRPALAAMGWGDGA